MKLRGGQLLFDLNVEKLFTPQDFNESTVKYEYEKEEFVSSQFLYNPPMNGFRQGKITKAPQINNQAI